MSLDAVIRDLIREAVRTEIQPLREELRAATKALEAQRKGRDPDSGRFLTVEEVAAELKVSRGTVRTWITAGALRASRPGVAGRTGRVYRVERSDLDSFLATKHSTPQDDVDIKAEVDRIVAGEARKRRR
jgi:excisionase family DNA binding protein